MCLYNERIHLLKIFGKIKPYLWGKGYEIGMKTFEIL